MRRSLLYVMLPVFLVVGLLAPIWSGDAFAQGSKGGTVQSFTIPPNQLYSCSGGFTFLSVGITTHGMVGYFESPAGFTQLSNSGRNGFGICEGGVGLVAAELADDGASFGWATAPSVVQPFGPGTFPLEITRDTFSGLRVTRRITGNSFIMPRAAGNPGGFDINGDGQLCSTLAECSNCTNRTIHVLTRITNLTFGFKDVSYIEQADFDASGGAVDDLFGRTGDSVIAWDDRLGNNDFPGDTRYGMLLQTLILPADTGVFAFDGLSGLYPDCVGSLFGLSTPVGFGDFVAWMLQSYVTLAPGANSGGAFRVHYRRF